MFCPHCGAKQDVDGAKFCGTCGKPLDADWSQASQPERNPPQTEEPQITVDDGRPKAPTMPSVQADSAGSKTTPAPKSASAAGSGPEGGVKKGVDPKILAIAAAGAVAVIVIAVVVVVFVVKPGGGPAPAPDPATSTQSAEPTGTSEPTSTQTTEPAQSLPSGNGVDHFKKTGTARFADIWRLESATFGKYDAATVVDNAAKGKYVLLTLKEDGTGTLDEMGTEVPVTWKMRDDKVGLYEGDGRKFEMRVADDGGLVLMNDNSEYMVFRACPAGDGANTGGSSAGDSDKTQKIGSKKVGYVQVPASWKDNTKVMDERTVEDYGLVLYIDPDSSYQSKAQGRESYSKAIQLTVQPTSYTEIAKGILESYKSDGKFGETTQESIEIAGRKGVVLVTTLKDDGLRLATIVLDRDGDGKVGVAMALNCGFDEASSKAVLQIASTWTRE